MLYKCLSKSPNERYRDLSNLSKALASPFASQEHERASVPLRATVFMLDLSLLMIPSMIYSVWHLGDSYLIPLLLSNVFLWIYFSISEGLWGASLMKYLAGIKVIDTKSLLPCGIKKAGSPFSYYQYSSL